MAYRKPTVKEPDGDELQAYVIDGVAEATDGCRTELDGDCSHGHVSWLIYLGLI